MYTMVHIFIENTLMYHIICSMLMCDTSDSHWIPGEVLKHHPPIIYSQKLKSISGICI